MKNPNGYGTVTKLSGNRRKPWIAKEGKTGKQKIIGYAPTKEAALALLADFNREPWDVDTASISLAQLYDLWNQKRAPRLSDANQRALRSVWKHIKALSKKPYRDIRAWIMQDTIDNCGRGASTQAKIKSLWMHLDRFALELGISSARYADLLTTQTPDAKPRTPFTQDEIALLWKHQKEPWVDSVLFLLYSGWRISEMFALTAESVDMEKQIMTGGIKTAAGKNRVVPIHTRILPIVEARLAEPGIYLFSNNGTQLTHDAFYVQWRAVMNNLGLNHTPHECRHTFRTLLDSAGANKVCIDRLLGHVSQGTGERVYTHKTIEELKSAIQLIK